ncbi:MAG: 3-hydroxyacyl-CoA dehydrogenase NAD-binding domain-containing protein [Flavobacteriales bacterium]
MENTQMIVGIVGAGAMGSGIAQIAAQTGWQVLLLDQSSERLAKSADQLASVCDRLVEKGRLESVESVAMQERIVRTTDLQSLASCHLIIEAIVEDFDAKKGVLQALEEIVGESTVLATNTSSLSVTGLAGVLKHPSRFLGLHFFNPAPLMALVEVVPAMQTDQQHVVQCLDWMKAWGKVPVQAKDTPGFIVNRIARPFYGEALRIVEEGLASPYEVDAAMKDAGFKMGPFELMDLIGNDVNYAVTKSVFEAFYFDPRYRPSLIQKRHVEAGWLGRKTGRGYYSYQDGKPLESPVNKTGDWGWIQNRILAMLMNEALDALALGIASAPDLELAMTRGVNYPKGLLEWANEWGLDVVLEQLQKLQSSYGEDRYRPAPLLQDLVQSKKSLEIH